MIPSKRGALGAACDYVLMKMRSAGSHLVAVVAALWYRLFGHDEAGRTAPRPAGEELPPLIAFSFAGMLWAYLIGVVAFLKEHFDLVRTAVHLSGVSCGTAAAMAIFLELSVEQAFELGLGWQTLFDSRPLRFWLISTREALRMVLAKYDAFGITDHLLEEKYARWSGLHIGVTAVGVSWWGGWLPVPKVSHDSLTGFKNFKEMTYAAMCSCRTLPFFRTPGMFRGSLCVDGAYTAPYAVPEEYRRHPEKVLRVGILNLPGSEQADISPDSNLSFAVHEWCDSGSVEANVQRFSKGYRDAAKLSSVLQCAAKGLHWAGPAHLPTPEQLAAGSAADIEAWQTHVDSRVACWASRLRKQFESQGA